MLFSSSVLAVTPPGTVINNIATLQYQVNTTTMTPLSSNTDSFTVLGFASLNQGYVDASGIDTNNLFPGSSTTFNIDLKNDGSNNLDNGVLLIRLAANLNFALIDPNATLLSQTTLNGITTYQYSIDALAVANSAFYSASIVWPINTQVNNNTLDMSYQANSVDIANTTASLNLGTRTQGVLQLFQYSADSDATPMIISPTEFLQSNNQYAPIPPPIINELGISVISSPIPVKLATRFTHKQIILIRLEEGDHNLNSTQKDTVKVDFNVSKNGETEQLKLTETAVNSGIFTGYITLNITDSLQTYNGTLNVDINTQVNINYIDDVDNTDSPSQIILVDPFGILFDSSTGALLNGYTVSMINVDTGLPAQVFGDDGVSTYPSTVITGGSVTDSGGNIYNFDDGAYRFPFAPLGNYKLVVTKPNNSTYTWPSEQPLNLINLLPEAPYAITLGSRGETFPLTAGPPLHIDIPLDRSNNPLYIRRSANTAYAAPGDFIRFNITVENIDSVAIEQVVLTDSLPQGFRLEKNSVYINKQQGTLPTISEDGQSLIFALNTLAAGESITIEYVAAVGAVRQGALRSLSHAIANSGATQSNTATVTTLITEELMRSQAIIMGQVIVEEDLDGNAISLLGLKGVRIYMEDGRYAITDERGMYHFDHVLPGVHVVQLDLDTLPSQYETVLKEDNTRFSGRAWSQFVDIQGGTLWRSDFHVRSKPKPQGSVTLQLSHSALIEGNALQYTLALNSHTVDIRNRRLTVMIPKHLHYQSGSSQLNAKGISDPKITANMLTFRLGDAQGTTDDSLQFLVSGVSSQTTPEMISKAFLMFNTPEKKKQRTSVITHVTMIDTNQTTQAITEKTILPIRFGSADVQLNAEDKRALARFAKKIKGLHNLRIHAVGHSDNRGLLPKTKLRFKDNYHLSANRATVIANELRDLLKLPPSHVTVEGRGADEPIAENTTPKGQRTNRRVHLNIYSDRIQRQPLPDSIQTQNSDILVMPTQGTHATTPSLNKTTASTHPSAPNFDRQWLNQQSSGTEWLYPKAGYLPQLATTRVAIKHTGNQQVTLLLNGKPVEKYNFEGTLKNTKGVMVSRWRGVDLKKGTNTFEAIITDTHGQKIQRLQRSVHFSTEPVQATILNESSILIADGIQNPKIAIQLLDKDGYPVRNGVSGQFKILPPYRAKQEGSFNVDVMSGTMANEHKYQVTQEGVAFITLEPTTESGEVQISLPFTNNTTKQLTTKLTADSTSWILVGLAEGALGYNTLKDKIIALNESNTDTNLYQDNRVAFFAKGKIQGKWLMTIAYDSNKKRPNNTDPELFQTIDPDTYYTIYGDSTYNGYAAPSSEKLYLKLEQDQFYFLFGDYQTGLNNTQLSKYNRTLTGIKSRYHDDRYDVIVFASNTNQAFVKDEFRGKGLTGPYTLTRNNIAMNSEKITLEVRDRLRSEKIVSSTQLSRHQDYQIDYQTGIISFRSPVQSTDLDINPQYIIVKYESFDDGDRQLTYGGRAKMVVNDKLTLGVSHINEGQTGGKASLEGIDAAYQLFETTKITLEAAQTVNKKVTENRVSGTSYLTEIEHQTDNSNTTIYARDQAQGFGLGQTNASENGLRKIGIDTALKATENITLKGQAYQQKSNDITRDLFEAKGQARIDNTQLEMGVRSVNDLRNNDTTQRSQQLTAGVRHQFMNNKISASIQQEHNINSDNSVDFPNRTRLGASYRMTPSTRLFIEQDISNGALNDSRNTLIGIKASPWAGGELYSGVTQTNATQGNSTRANVSARQAWQLNKQWRLELGAEEVNILDSTPSTVQQNSTPFVAPISDEFTAGSLGITYLPRDWMWSARVEARNGTLEDRWQLATSLQTNPNTNLSTLSTLAFSNSQQRNGALKKESAIRLGLAYRPPSSHHQGNWILLNKLDLKWSDTNAGAEAGNNWRIINNLNANYKRNRWQLALQYAAKTVNETINNQDYSSFTDLTGFETRYDLTPKWDIGVHGNVLRSVNLNQYDYNTGVSVGRSINKNIWVSLGYNLIGFNDEDFSASRNTNEGAFLRFRIKFDQATVRDAVQWVGQ